MERHDLPLHDPVVATVHKAVEGTTEGGQDALQAYRAQLWPGIPGHKAEGGGVGWCQAPAKNVDKASWSARKMLTVNPVACGRSVARRAFSPRHQEQHRLQGQ